MDYEVLTLMKNLSISLGVLLYSLINVLIASKVLKVELFGLVLTATVTAALAIIVPLFNFFTL